MGAKVSEGEASRGTRETRAGIATGWSCAGSGRWDENLEVDAEREGRVCVAEFKMH